MPLLQFKMDLVTCCWRKTGETCTALIGVEMWFLIPRICRRQWITKPTPSFRYSTAQEMTGDVYIGGEFTMYDGVVVNHFARIHGDGELASVISTGP